MTLETLSKLNTLQRVAPCPWYLDQCNSSGVCVKDLRGGIVFYEDLSTIPDEMPLHVAEDIRQRAISLASFLVSLSSEVRNPN